MSTLFYENTDFIKIVIAAMVTFLGSEFMAIFPIFSNFKKNEKNVMKHIVPIWEITGTMIVFFVVELELIYSALTPIASYLFIPLIGTFVLLIILRNVWIIYAEFLWKHKDYKEINNENLYRFYSIATFIMVVAFITGVLTLMYGKGIHLNLTTLQDSYINYIPILSTGYYWSFMIGTLFIAYGLSTVFYRTIDNKSYIPLITVIIGLILSIVGLSGIATADKVPSSDLYFLIIPVILTLMFPILYRIKSTTNIASYKPLFFVLMVISIFIIEEPVTYIAGGAFPLTDFASANSTLSMNIIISGIGGSMFVLLMIMYSYVYSNEHIEIENKPVTKKAKN